MTPDPLTPSPDTSAQDAIDRKLTEAGWKFHPASHYSDGDVFPSYWTRPCDSGHLRTQEEALAMVDALRGTPSPDSPTPRCDALGVDEWILPDNRLVVSIKWKDLARQLERELAALVKEREALREELATTQMLYRSAVNSLPTMSVSKADLHVKHLRAEKERDQLRATLAERDREISRLHTKLKVDVTQQLNEKAALRAQLAETEGKLKEAEAAHAQLTERYKTTHDHWIAAEERWKQVQQTLIRVQAEYAEREESRPDLTLIEEVRGVAEETATIFDELDTVQWDENGCPVSYQGTQERIIQLLARLNPRK